MRLLPNSSSCPNLPINTIVRTQRIVTNEPRRTGMPADEATQTRESTCRLSAKALRAFALGMAVVLGGCVLEPKIVTRPTAAVRSLLPVGDIASSPMPHADPSVCPLMEARTALTHARMSRLFLADTAAARYRDALAWSLLALEASCGESCGHSADAATHTYDKALEGLLRAVGCGLGSDARAVAARLENLGVSLVAADGFMNEVEPDEFWFAKDFATFRVASRCGPTAWAYR